MIFLQIFTFHFVLSRLAAGWRDAERPKNRHAQRGGEGGIRTHGTGKGTTLFESVPFNHSGTSPNLHYS